MNSIIGSSNESSLHRMLKYRYTGEEGSTETVEHSSRGDFICDGRTGKGEIIEVQTGSFGPLRDKINALAEENKVRIIHPIIIQKHIELYDTKGRLLRKRKSPRKGSAWDLFKYLIYAPTLPLLPNVTVELVLIDILEKRIDDGTGSWRRKGARIADKSLAVWHKSVLLKIKDYRAFIPFKKGEKFTVKNLGEKAGIAPALAGKCLYVLHKLNIIEKTGKQKNAFVYRLITKPESNKPAPERQKKAPPKGSAHKKTSKTEAPKKS